MEEEKKKRKIREVNILETEDLPASSKAENKKAYKVVLVTVANVVYQVGKDCNSVTANIWGMHLKPGDEIYL